MACVQVLNVTVQNNPAKFTDEFQFDITFECIAPGVQHELEWKLIYVSSASNESLDQELDAVMVGPVVVGKNKFQFVAPAPDISKIPTSDLLEVTVLLLTCSYQEHEFIRIGYYVNNEMELTPEQQSQINAINEAAITNNTPVDETAIAAIRGEITVDKVWRNILIDKPRVTRFNIPWDRVEQFPELTAEERAKLEATVGIDGDDGVVNEQNENDGFDTETLESDEEGEDDNADTAEAMDTDMNVVETLNSDDDLVEEEEEGDQVENEDEIDETENNQTQQDEKTPSSTALNDVTNTTVSA